METNYRVLLTYTHCFDEDFDIDDADRESWYEYDLIVPDSLAEATESALDYCGISWEWMYADDDTHNYRLDPTDATGEDWHNVFTRLSLAMSEFTIECGYDAVCYSNY